MTGEISKRSPQLQLWIHRLFLTLLLVVWYLFSYLFNSSLKDWFRVTEDHACTLFPLLLTVFLSNAVVASLWSLHSAGCLLSPRKTIAGLHSVAGVLVDRLRLDFVLLCSSGAVGIAASCVVLQQGSIQLVQVARSVGPLFTALWAYLILDQPTTGSPLACLAITLIGTALASWQEPTFSMLTFCLMLTINMTLTFRNAVTKRVIQTFTLHAQNVTSSAGGDVHLMGHLEETVELPSSSSTLEMHHHHHHQVGKTVPLLVSAGKTVSTLHRALNPPSSQVPPTASSGGFHQPAVMSCLLLALTNLCGLVIITILWSTQAFCVPWVQQSGGHALGAEWSIAQASILPTDAWGLLINLGICNLMYNMASQIVLAHVSVVSHGMLELFKRVFVLLTASVLLGDVDWKLHNALGASIATLGTVLYFTSGPSHAVNSISASTKHNPSSQKVVGILVTPAASPSSVTKRLGSSAGQSKEKDRSSNVQGQAGPAVNAYTAAAEAVPRTLVGSEHLRLHCAYGIMFLVLIFSPIEFLEGAGVSTLSPKWFTAVSTSSSTATAVAESWSTWIRQPNSNDNMSMPTSKGTIPTIGTAKTDSASLVNGGISSSPVVNQPVSINYSERLIVPAPNATMYNPIDSTSEVLVGGISKLKGLLPYHKTLRRASALTASCKHLQTLPKSAQQTSSTHRVLNGMGMSPCRLLPPPLASDSVSHRAQTILRQPQASVKTPEEPVQAEPDSQRRWLNTAEDISPGFVGMYTGWLGKRNLGDDIVADIFLDLLVASIIEATDDTTCVTLERSSKELTEAGWRDCSMSSGAGCDFGVLGGGSLVYVDYIKRLAQMLIDQKPVLLFGTGHQSGLRKKSTNDKYLGILCKGRVMGGVRGHHTKGFLARYGCPSTVKVMRDSALVSDLLYTGGKTVLRGELSQHRGRYHTLVATLKGSTSLPVFNDTLYRLMSTGKFAVVLQAVDEESARLHRHYTSFFNDTRPKIAPPVLFHEEFEDWAAILDLYRHSSASLNSRLHSGVMSLAAGRPSVYLANNVKYSDLMGSLDMHELLMDSPSRLKPGTEDPSLIGEHMAQLVASVIRQGASFESKLKLIQEDTMRQYKRAMVDFLNALQQLDAVRFSETLCCKHIHITRSEAREHRMLISIRCQRKADLTDLTKCQI